MPVTTPLLLVAHGTREPAGPREIERIAVAAARELDVPVHVAYVDVIGPTVAEAVREIDGPAVVLPAFLAAGYHVRTDLPEQLGDAEAVVCPPLGPAPELAEVMQEHLTSAGWRPGDRVLFSAAGSSDDRALQDVREAAHLLGRSCGQWLSPTYVTTARPLTADRCDGTRRTFIAPYLLAPGLFHRRLAELPVAGVADPIGAHPKVIDLVVRRYRAAVGRGRSAA